MRASRLLSVLLLLQSRGRMTAPEIARELEVSVRTVYRDIESLATAGVPVYADRGPAGAYQLVDGYRTRLTGLTADEAESLFLSGMPAPAAAELGLGSVMAAAQLKLKAALPPELRARAGRVQERFHLDAPGWFRDIERPEHLAAVAEAVWNQRLVEVRYERWGRTVVTRTVAPYGLVMKTGVWYLAALPTRGRPEAENDETSEDRPAAETMRTYRVSRIRALATLDDRFERESEFDLAAYWESWSEQYRARLYQAEAVVRLSPLAQDLIAYYMGPVVARAARESAGPPDENGWVRVVIPVESHTHVRHELFRFGPDVEVLEPPELRAYLTEQAQLVHRLYSGE